MIIMPKKIGVLELGARLTLASVSLWRPSHLGVRLTLAPCLTFPRISRWRPSYLSARAISHFGARFTLAITISLVRPMDNGILCIVFGSDYIPDVFTLECVFSLKLLET
uniref:Uncharacterized protein n=1 Tax=Romanomermis culicivorax TaxID=13658 RepID=A0A915J1M7_ROMCU